MLVPPDWKSDYKVRASRFRKTSDRETGSICLSLNYESVVLVSNDPVEGDRLRRDQLPSLPRCSRFRLKEYIDNQIVLLLKWDFDPFSLTGDDL